MPNIPQKLKYVRIRTADGTYSSPIPLATDYEHIDVRNNGAVVTTLDRALLNNTNNTALVSHNFADKSFYVMVDEIRQDVNETKIEIDSYVDDTLTPAQNEVLENISAAEETSLSSISSAQNSALNRINTEEASALDAIQNVIDEANTDFETQINTATVSASEAEAAKQAALTAQAAAESAAATAKSEVETAINALKGEGLEDAYDTLVEIQNLMKADDTETANLLKQVNENTSTIDLMLASLTEEPAITKPSITVSTTTKTVEVGSTVSGSYSITFDDGNYSFGPASTGSVVSTVYVKLPTDSAYRTGATGSHTYSIALGTSETTGKVYTKADYTAALNAPVDNWGRETEGAFTAGTTDEKSATLYNAYRAHFFGFSTTQKTSWTNTEIRNAGAKVTSSVPSSATASNSWTQFWIAVADGEGKTLKGAKTANGLPFNTTGSYKVSALPVGSSSSTQTLPYTVYYINTASAVDAGTITLTW